MASHQAGRLIRLGVCVGQSALRNKIGRTTNRPELGSSSSYLLSLADWLAAYLLLS